MLSVKKKIQDKCKILKATKGVNPIEVYIGNYKHSSCDPCKYKVIIGNAEFSECENLDISNLQYISGNLEISDSYNVKVDVKTIGDSLILTNNHNLCFNNLQEIKGDCIVSDTFIETLPKLQKIDGQFCFSHSKVEKGNHFINDKIYDELFFESEK